MGPGIRGRLGRLGKNFLGRWNMGRIYRLLLNWWR
jgi:hypothetical protein